MFCKVLFSLKCVIRFKGTSLDGKTYTPLFTYFQDVSVKLYYPFYS